MAISPFEAAINQICDEKKLARDIVISTIEAALAAAYRKEYGKPKEVLKAKLNLDDITKTEIFRVFTIVEDEEFVEETNQVSISEAKKKNKKAKVGDEIVEKLPSKGDFGRIAAQTAKQVIIQRLQEAERDVLYDEFKDKENQLVNVVIQQINPQAVIATIGRVSTIMPRSEQIQNERYYIGQRLKAYVLSVEKSPKEPRIIISRAHPELIKKLFEIEVPEISAETVIINGISREAGVRTKMSVSANQEGLDPVGSCVGQRGVRIQSVLSEISPEKIDIILYNEDPKQYIINSLSPAKIEKVVVNKKKKEAQVHVKDDQLSLAIGKSGQNVRLASKLTEYKIDIIKEENQETVISSNEEIPTEEDQKDQEEKTTESK